MVDFQSLLFWEEGSSMIVRMKHARVISYFT